MKVHVIYEEVAVFFVPRTEWFHSNCISRSVCVAVSFFPDQRNGPSEKFFQRGFLKMKLSICITTWRGKFKLGHLITRKHRSAHANYWFNLKIFILWSSGETSQEFVWKYLRPFLGIKNTVKFWIRNTSPHFHSASLSIWRLHVEKNLFWRVIHF